MQQEKKDVASLQAYLNAFINPIVDLLPKPISRDIKKRKRSQDMVAEGIMDVVAQAVYLDKHLNQIISESDCGIDLQCKGQDFGQKCIVSQSVLNKEEHARFEMLLNAISVEVGWRSASQIFQEKCQVRKFLTELSAKAQKINPMGSGGVDSCQPSFDLLDGKHEKVLNDFLNVLFDESENPKKC